MGIVTAVSSSQVAAKAKFVFLRRFAYNTALQKDN